MGREYPQAPVVGVGAVVLRVGTCGLEVLLARRANPPLEGEWSLPGGVVELGERLEEAVVREVEEETGLRPTVLGMIEVLDRVDRAKDGRVRFHYVLVDYACGVAGGSLKAASDALEVRWVACSGLAAGGEPGLREMTFFVIKKAVDRFGACFE